MNNKLRETLRTIAVRRLHLVPISDGELAHKVRLGFLTELAALGYLVTNPEAVNASVREEYDKLVDVLKAMRGGDVEYVPLFQGFPNSVPDDNEYFARRIIGYLGNAISAFDEGRELASGVLIPEWLFDLSQFGADPILQIQEEGLFQRGVQTQADRKQDEESATQWIKLRLAPWDEVEREAKQFLLRNLYAKSSIKESLQPDIEFLLNYFGSSSIDPRQLVFKETRTYVMKLYWARGDFSALQNLCSTPTDLLRLFAALTETDISLAESIKFPRFRRAQRRFVLGVLQQCSNLVEDLLRHKGLWLEIGRFLHPGEFAKQFPHAAEAFDAIRNGKPVTYNGRVEQAVEQRDVPELVRLLSQRPGVFARRIHQVLELAGDAYPAVLAAFGKAAPEVPLKNLLVLQSHLKTIERSVLRTIINKRGRIRVMANRRDRISQAALDGCLSVLQEAILQVIESQKSSWQGKRVWIDQRLRNYTVPLQQRKASDGLLTIGRGSQLPLDLGKVLRLFVWWKQAAQRTDLDLSLIQFDNDLNYAGHVSYTNLKSDGIVHSGDLQSAPHGAAEFIDVDLATVRALPKCRYIASQVYRYCGDNFGGMDCHAGWMIRDQVDAEYKSFDIKTVQNKFDLTGSSGYSIPIIIDLQRNVITFVDIYVGGVGVHNQVEGAFWDISIIAGEMVRMIETRPNMYDLARYNALGRHGELVSDQTRADISLGMEGCDYNVQEIDKTLSELI